MNEIKVTVYITSHNYGRFLSEAVESVVRQTLTSWELFIVDDGSNDTTADTARQFAAHDTRISIIEHPEPLGLRASANEVIERARGQYIIRLDADDFLDESALLVLSAYLDENPEVGLVYPNWIYINERGGFLGIESRKKIGREARVLDLPAHGACTMVRKRVLKSVGGYDTSHDAQDGHELWLKVLSRFGVANVQTPLFYYRQHGSSMSRDENRLLLARSRIKEDLASRHRGAVAPRAVAIIPVKNTYEHMPNVALEPIAGKPLLDYTVEAALHSGRFDRVFVYCDDEAVVRHCSRFSGILVDLRSPDLSAPQSKLADVLVSAVHCLEEKYSVYPDILAVLSIHSPLRTSQHIGEALDTLALYGVDNVISTYEDRELHFIHGRDGMEPLNAGMLLKLRFEREALFVDNGAVHVCWRDVVNRDTLYHGRIGHFVMPREVSSQIKSLQDRARIECDLMSQRRSCQQQS